MRYAGTRSLDRNGWSVPRLLTALFLLFVITSAAFGATGINLIPEIPGSFDPEADLRAPKSLYIAHNDTIAGFNHEAIAFRVETEFDTLSGYWVAKRSLFGKPYGREMVYTPEQYRAYRLKHDRKAKLLAAYKKHLTESIVDDSAGGLEIQVPFKIKSKTFRRIFGGDRVGLRVSGNISIDGGLRRETTDQKLSNQADRANYNFKIDQTQQFRIVGKVGDKVSVEIDQDSERVFDFENNVKLTYTGYEDEILQKIEAGNVSLSLPGTQLATMTANNQGLFGFKTEARIGPLSVTAIASLQKGEKNKLSYKGGSGQGETSRIRDKEYVKNRYFFIDKDIFREQYFTYSDQNQHITAEYRIDAIQVYTKFVGLNTIDALQGVAVYDSDEEDKVPNISGKTPAEVDGIISGYVEEHAAESWVYNGLFKKLEPGVDYVYNADMGYVRVSNPVPDGSILAIAYTLGPGAGQSVAPKQVGTVEGDVAYNKLLLKLIKTKNPLPTDSTWDLEWKHVYSLGAKGVKRENLKIKIETDSGKETKQGGSKRTWLETLDLDRFNESGEKKPDGIIDAPFFNADFGELEFPDPTPFAPTGHTYAGSSYDLNSLIDTLGTAEEDIKDWSNSEIYTKDRKSLQQVSNKFNLVGEFATTSSNISLGINVLEGSEEIFLDGVKLTRDKDYVIDYYSGQITILKQGAMDPNANLEIKYESGEIFQLDQRTMVGIRLQYDLSEDSFVGGTLLYFNEKPIEKRVKVGNEPLRNTIWDVNAQLRFKPYFMTSMVNALPFIETDEPSELTFEGEIAQVFPNPNSLTNSATGDENGVAYIDDFEASKRATPMSIKREGWSHASQPEFLYDGETANSAERIEITENDKRGLMHWYNPRKRTPIKDIWENREVNSKVDNSVTTMNIIYDPSVNNYLDSSVEPEKTWNGLMRYLSPGFHNQINSKYLELWVKWNGGGEKAALYIDMGQVSEDVIANGALDTEDKPLGVGLSGNGILDDGEDTGLDGREGADPPIDATDIERGGTRYDWWDLDGNGEFDDDEPFSFDNWVANVNPSESQEKNNYQINGTEKSAQDGEIRIPDTEDLNGDNALNTAQNYCRYRFRLYDYADEAKYIRGGKDNEKGWRLIRIPLEDVFYKRNQASKTSMETMRLWVSGCSQKLRLSIAQIEIVGNDWQDEPYINTALNDTITYVTASTINTHDNAETYDPPPGVAGEIDPITDLRSKEQSLVMKLLDMPTASEGEIVKRMTSQQNLLEYRQLKMFVNGGGTKGNLEGHDLVMFLRFGSDLKGANKAYYEYSQPIRDGWENNEIVINLDQLTALKSDAQQAGSDDYTKTLANGDVLRVVGEPTLGKINMYSLGIRNMGRPVSKDEELEVWVDELRLSGVRKETGMAMRSSVKAKFADLMTVDVSMKQKDAAFHQVDQRMGADKSTIEGNLNVNMNLDKVFDPSWGIKIPVKTSLRSDLAIPKYSDNNGDVRVSSITDNPEDLNVWKQFSRIGFSKDHLNDRLFYDEQGNIQVDPETGVPYQDQGKWGIDSLLTTNQANSWSVSFNKGKPSRNIFGKILLDKVNLSMNHSEKYQSSLRYQYQKSFTTTGKVSYSYDFKDDGVKPFRWTSEIPVLKSLSDAKLSYVPSKLSFGTDINESKSSNKYRNAKDQSTYKMSMNRNFATGYAPFRIISFDYSYSASSQNVPEDSTRQNILYKDQPDSVWKKIWAPTMPIETIVDSTILELGREIYGDAGAAIADSAEARLARGRSAVLVLEEMFDEIDDDLPEFTGKKPWDHVDDNDPRFKDNFYSIAGKPFADVTKTHRFSGSFNPEFVKWLGTDFKYSSTYNWNWSGFTYSGRSVKSTSNYSGKVNLKLKQLFRGAKSSSGRSSSSKPRADGFGRSGDDEPKKKKINLNFNPVGFLASTVGRLHDISANYDHNTSHNVSGVENKNPSWEYIFGLEQDPGVERVEGVAGVPSLTTTEDITIRSGVDITRGISIPMDYQMRVSETESSQLSGTVTHTGFYLFDENQGKMNPYDMPNFSLRLQGLERIGFFDSFVTSMSYDMSYRGSVSEKWSESSSGRSITKTFDKGFSPLVGFNFKFKYGITANVKYNMTEKMTYNKNTPNKPYKRNSNTGLSFMGSYSMKKGFSIPIPIWPFKNRRFKNETTFSMKFESTNVNSSNYIMSETDGNRFEEGDKQVNWSVEPTVRYKFSRTVEGSVRFKHGETKSKTQNSKYNEFGINVKINIRG